MACIKKLKEDIGLLKKLFPSGHDLVRVTEATVDEINVTLILPNGEAARICANIAQNYPRVAAIWCSEYEEEELGHILQQLSDEKENVHILMQIHQLIVQYFAFLCIPIPGELEQLISPRHIVEEMDEGQGSDISNEDEREQQQPSEEESVAEEEDDEEYEEEDEDENDGMIYDISEFDSNNEPTTSSARDVFPEAEQETLDKLNILARADRVANRPQLGSTSASDRLMKELKDCYRSIGYKSGLYSLSIIDENLYEWEVKVHAVDSDSPLAQDLIKLKERDEDAALIFRASFKEDYPMSPPFVHVKAPHIENGYVMSGGALCMELLTPSGWSSAYSMDAVITQIGCTLVKGKARIGFDVTPSYTQAKAQSSWSGLVKFHNKSGWYTPPKSDG